LIGVRGQWALFGGSIFALPFLAFFQDTDQCDFDIEASTETALGVFYWRTPAIFDLWCVYLILPQSA
jgi:hypothetical protein